MFNSNGIMTCPEQEVGFGNFGFFWVVCGRYFFMITLSSYCLLIIFISNGIMTCLEQEVGFGIFGFFGLFVVDISSCLVLVVIASLPSSIIGNICI